MTRSIASLLLLAGLCMSAAPAAERTSKWRKVWRVSQVLLAGADAADVASSWGKNEANPLLHTGSRFSYGSLAIKLGVCTSGLVAQHYIVRKDPHQIPFYASANLAVVAVLGVVVAHNMQVAPVK